MAAKKKAKKVSKKKTTKAKAKPKKVVKKKTTKAKAKPKAKKATKKTTKKKATKAKAKPKKVAKKTTKKKAAKKKTTKTKRKPNAAFMRPLQLSAPLAGVLGATSLARTEVVKKLWVYIKKHDLQDKTNRRMINADAKLKEVFGKAKVNMFEMTKLVSKHLK